MVALPHKQADTRGQLSPIIASTLIFTVIVYPDGSMGLIRQLPDLDPRVVQTDGAPVREAASLKFAKNMLGEEGLVLLASCVFRGLFLGRSLCLYACLLTIHYQSKLWTHLLFFIFTTFYPVVTH